MISTIIFIENTENGWIIKNCFILLWDCGQFSFSFNFKERIYFC